MNNNFNENKNANNKVDILYNFWLGLVDIFQTFEDLESVKDKQADIKAVRKLLDGEKPKEPKQ
jgi:hypothetical protein